MEIEKLSKKFYDIVNISFKGENVKVLRNKKNFKWLFLKEENGALLPLPKNINKELHEIYSSEGGDYEVSITDCKFFDCNVKNVNLKRKIYKKNEND